MLTKNDFQQIREIVKEEIDPVRKGLDTVEIKVELVDKRVEGLEGRLGKVEKNLERKIMQTQEDTIDALSELINTSYNLHEKRIKKVEDVLQMTNPQ